jgi:hypothetical protein
MAAAGLMPPLNVPGADRTIRAIVQDVRRTGDALPLASWLAMAARRAAELDARCARVAEP